LNGLALTLFELGFNDLYSNWPTHFRLAPVRINVGGRF
jgi:hypothetical protein